jgi:predicted nucleic acid-binding protein
VPVFVDTNVLVYARDASEPDKQPQALAWTEHLWRTRTARLSFQVLQEYYAATTRKLKPGLSPEQARADILLTEDLQHGSELDGLRVVNPFRTPPGSLD